MRELLEVLDRIERRALRRVFEREVFAAELLARRGEIAVIASNGYIKPGSAVAWIEKDVVTPFGYVVDARKRGRSYVLAVKEFEEFEGNEIVEADNVINVLLRRDAAERADEILKFSYWNGEIKSADAPEWLDRWQRECFMASLSLENGEILLVVGPPGSGKTTFIAEAAKRLADSERVWVTSNTNIAVDNVLERLDSALRVGHPSKVSDSAKRFSVEHAILTSITFTSYHDYAAKISEAYREIARIQNEVIGRGRIVVGSTILKGMMSPVKNYDFDTVFIDEASNTCISTALLALERAEKAVVVGDPFQLPPVYEVPVSNAAKFSAFNFLRKMYGRSLWLRRHYRCNADIAAFAAKYVYGFLEIDERCRHVKLEKCRASIEAVGDPDKAVVFIDCDGEEKRVGRSKINEVEAEIVSAVCDDLSSCIDEENIGVITPYVRQKELIASLLSDFGLKIEVSTVHSYQGREKDVIVYSITATSNPYFASEKRIFNVALTRARKKFIAVGNSKSIAGRNFLLSKFLSYVVSKGGYVSFSKRI